MLAFGPARLQVRCRRAAAPASARHPEHAQAALGQGFDLMANGAAPRLVEVAQVGYGLGRALGRQQVFFGLAAGENARHGQNIGRKGVLELRLAPVMHMLGARQPVMAEALDRLFHRIERVARRGQHRKLDQMVKVLGQFAGLVWDKAGIGGGQLGYGHAVDRQRAGFVHRQHGDRAQRLDRRDAPRQHLLLRQTPRTQRQKHGQDDGDFLRQNRHRQRNAGQQAVQQRTAIPQPAQQHLRQRQNHRAHAESAHQLARAFLQGRCGRGGGGQISANAPDSRGAGSGLDFGHTDATGDDGAGVEQSPHACHFVCCAAPRGGWPGLGRPGAGGRSPFVCRADWFFGHGHGFASEQRLIDLQQAFNQPCIGGDAVALM